MRVKTAIIGIILIILGVGLYFYYDFYYKPNKLMLEGELLYERGDKDSVNNAINSYKKIILDHSGSKYVPDAWYYIARCYEKIGLQDLAYRKYIYLIKTNKTLSNNLKKEILIRIARVNSLKQYPEEAISQLYSLLNTNYNKEFRSRIYAELGYLHLKQKDFRKAKRMFDISMFEHSNEDALIGQARAYKWMGRDNDAYDLYETFLKYYGAVSQYTRDVKRAYRDQAYNSGLNAFRGGHYRAAVSFFSRVLANFYGERISENALYWAGECYYGLGEFDKAIYYFNKVLTNGYYHKDEDARIKKGYAYFTSKRFDLAAREFQVYLQQYSNGKYAPVARNWKDMSTKELLFRIQNKKLPDVKDTTEAKEQEMKTAPKQQLKQDEELEEDNDNVLEEEKDEEISGEYYKDSLIDSRIEMENVAEL